MKRNLLLSIAVFLIGFSLKSQNYLDCNSALTICSKSDLEIYLEKEYGDFNENISNTCEIKNLFDLSRFPFVWTKYTFASSGNFTFNIIPKNLDTDIDFIVYQSNNNNCESLEAIRCMFTGESNPGPSSPECLGATGLSFNSTDLSEDPGCQNDSDNYLAPLQVETGDIAFLLIINFSGDTFHDYTIEHDGTAELVCEQLSTNEEIAKKEFTIFPNPISDIIKIEGENFNDFNGVLKIITVTGKEILCENISAEKEIDLSHLQKGTYFAQYINDNFIESVQKVIKL